MGHYAAVWDYKAATEMTKDWNGIDQVVLKSPHGGSARVSLHGGQVTSWRNEHGEELLFTSSKVILMILAANAAVGVITETNVENHAYMPLDSQLEVPNHVYENHA